MEVVHNKSRLWKFLPFRFPRFRHIKAGRIGKRAEVTSEAVRMRSDDRDFPNISPFQRKHLMTVLKHRNTLTGNLFIQLIGRLLMQRVFQLCQMWIGVFEKAHCELGAQDPADCLINHIL